MMEEQKTYLVMTIYPNGIIEDITITEIPISKHRISIANKSYYIIEAHVSAIDKFDYVMTLGG